MDKLIKNRFWILLALVPPLVIFGYYKANGAIQAATEERVKQLDAALTAIPDGKGPNPTFVDAKYGGLEVFNKELNTAVQTEMVRVWEDQKPRMTWPIEMETFVPRDDRGEMAYRGEFVREAAFTYKAEYQDQLEKLYESIEPLKQETNGSMSGKVRLDPSAIPFHQFGDMLVPSEAIWDAQEDLWLLQLLFDAVRNVNRPAENAAKSAVRWLYYVELMGGTGESTVMATAGSGAPGSDGDEVLPGRAAMMSGSDEDDRGGFSGGMRARMGGMTGQVTVGFDPSEEFGVGSEMAAAGAVDDGDEVLPGGMPLRAGGAAGMGGFGGGKPIRYIAAADSKKFQERGFYMSVLIDQKKIADFLVELSNADWPIRIVRFNVGPNTGGAGGGRAPTRMMAGSTMGGFGGGTAADFAGVSGLPSALMMRGGREEDDAAAFAGPGFSNGDEILPGGFGATGADGPGMGMRGGVIGAASPLVQADQIGQLFSHPDLVQLDLCGVITMYKPPAADSLAAVTGATPTDGAATSVPADSASTEPADSAAAEPADDNAQPATEPEPAEPAATEPDAATVPATVDPTAAPVDAPAEPAPAEAAPSAATPTDAAAEAAPAPGT